MQIMKRIALSAALLPLSAAWAGGDGLTTDADRVPWATFQGRIAYATTTADWGSQLTTVEASGLKVRGLSLMGDVYFGADSSKLQASGFRATSGVIVGARSSLWSSLAPAPGSGLLSVGRRLFGESPTLPTNPADAASDSATLPYLGIGYSSLSLRSGWSFSADLGLVSLSPSNAVRLGRVVGGGQNLDDVVHDMRLAPVLQLGVSYSF